MENENRPLSEIYQQAAEEWVDLEAAADLLENMKSVVMAQRQAQLGDIPVNRAEQMVKASQDWQDYVQSVADARRAANLAKVKVETIKMRFGEFQSREANNRVEARL